MAANVEEVLIDKIRTLPLEKQREVLDLVEDLARPATPERRTIWEKVEDIIKEVPPEAWDGLPPDGSLNVDHYLYGAPKK